MKTFKVNVPEGYEIDKEKSTFENIVFKKKDDVVIRWSENYNGVEIKADGEHFITDFFKDGHIGVRCIKTDSRKDGDGVSGHSEVRLLRTPQIQ